MEIEGDRTSHFVADSRSKRGEICVPLAVATVPAGLFTLLGFISKGLDEPGAEAPLLVIVAMIAVQTLGMIAMAFVLLTRLELGMRTLIDYTNGHPHVWRKRTLMLSFACLLIFDVVTNVSAAFAGAGFLVVAAVPVFVAYLVFNRVAFAGLWLSPPQEQSTA